MKNLFFGLMVIAAAVSVNAQECCSKKAEAKKTAHKTEAKQESCSSEAKQGSCGTEAKKSSCGLQANADDEFMAEAHRMMMKADGKTECCKSTAEKVMAKGEKGCCNAEGEPAKFKVYVAGAGYKYFGCEGSAAKGRKELVAKGGKVGKVQKVSSRVAMR